MKSAFEIIALHGFKEFYPEATEDTILKFIADDMHEWSETNDPAYSFIDWMHKKYHTFSGKR